MGVRILDSFGGESCFYCSTTMWAFGPIFTDEAEAEDFLKWLSVDPRTFTNKYLESKYAEFMALTDGDCADCGLPVSTVRSDPCRCIGKAEVDA